jgi:hypothetical protein
MVNDKVSIIDVKGELTAFAEGVLTLAYTQGWHRVIRECQAGGGGSRKLDADTLACTPLRKTREQFHGCKHTSLTFLAGSFSETQFSLAQIKALREALRR